MMVVNSNKVHSQLIAMCFALFAVCFLQSLCNCKKDKGDSNPSESNILWSTQLSAEIYYCSPALNSDESVLYIGTSGWMYGEHRNTQEFVALNSSNGKILWSISMGRNEVRSSPAIAADNSIYFVVEVRDDLGSTILRDELWKVSPQGDTLWKYNINPTGLIMDIGLSVPAIGSDGTIYVAGDKLYAIKPDGTLRWTAFNSTYEPIMNSPIIGTDGTIYLVYHNIPLTALNPVDGSVKWFCQLGVNDHCFSSPSLGPNGEIYVAQHPSTLYAVSSSGSILWTFQLSSIDFTGFFRASPTIGRDGTVYFGINYGNPSSAFFAIKNDGTLKWRFEPADLPPDVPKDHFDIYSSAALGIDSTVYFGQEFGRIYALKIKDGTLVSLTETKSGITWSSPVISKKGILYISDLSGTVYAVRTNSMGLDSLASWPKFRFNQQNTGRKILH